jgi:hypothetical protein
MLQFIKANSKKIFLILALLLTLPTLIGLMHSGFPSTDDGGWMVIRFSAFFQTLRSGEFPVRFLMRLNNGYGYPVADFLYPLFMYLSVPIHILGINFVNTIKILLGLCIITSSLFTFLWLRKMFDNLSALVGAAFYVYFPYHLFDIYQRGSVGEILALSILPFILWQIERRSLRWTAIGIALLITAHNTLALLFMLLILPYLMVKIYLSKNQKSEFNFSLITLLTGFGLSAFFWIPAVFDLQYTVFAKTSISNVGNYFSGIGLIGIAAIVVISLVIIFMLFKKVEIKKHQLVVVMLIIAITSIFLASPLSSLLWRFLPSSFVQFPFRLLSLTIPSVSFLVAYLVSVFGQKKKILICLIFIILIIISTFTYLLPKVYQNFPDTYYSTNQDTTTVKNEYMPKWVKVIPQKMSSAKVQNLIGKEVINLTKDTPNRTEFKVFLTEQRLIQVNTIYFPGWQASVNGEPAEILYDNPNGLISLNLNKGANNVEIKFSETAVGHLADLVSIISIGYLLIFISARKKKK